MVLICEQEANFVTARNLLPQAVSDGRLGERSLKAAARRMDASLALAGEPEEFDNDEFQVLGEQIAALKHELESSDETSEYAPLFGTEKGGWRRSPNF